jgi:hypothetical protein
MKTNKFFLLGIFTLLMLGFTIVSCEKSEITPTEPTSGVLDKRGGNGGGGGGNNPNSPNYNPCSWISQYTNATAPAEVWGITVDTTICGFVILRWPQQAKFSPVDSCTAAGAYYVATTPVVGTYNTSCAGNLTYSNAYYYQLGSGCSMWPDKEYRIYLSYLERDTVNKVLRWHYSEGVQFKTGTRATYLGTCP